MLCGYGPSEVFNPEFAKVSSTQNRTKTKTKMNDFLYETITNSFYYSVCLEISPACDNISQIGIHSNSKNKCNKWRPIWKNLKMSQ